MEYDRSGRQGLVHKFYTPCAVLAMLVALGAFPAMLMGGVRSDVETNNGLLRPYINSGNGKHRSLQVTTGYETSKLLEKFQIAKAKFMEKLVVDYGAENVDAIFKVETSDGNQASKAVSAGRVLFAAGDAELNWSRVRRKVMIKILQAQIKGSNQPFVWATGGHSASAGHGNLYNESYTAAMERGSSDIFKAVGMDLTARNYGMGATASGMEIAACMKETFGLDPDAMSWDYGMTTTGALNKVEYWFYRAALLPNKPALMCIACSERMLGRFGNVLEEMQERGLAVFQMDHETAEKKIPDTDGKTQEEIDAMPIYIRSFRCGTKLEHGDPTCSDEKYTMFPDNEPCNNRQGRVSWHPGWKSHALKGNLLTLFWTDVIDDALQEILSQGSDPQALLTNLVDSENKDYEQMLALGLPKHVDSHLNQTADIPNEVIYNKPNFCHIARTPSQIRYQGVLTESNEKDPTGWRVYDHGVELNEVRESAEEGGEMKLTWDKDLYQGFCKNHEIEIDHRDFFFANSEAWSKMTLPNPTEKTFYGTNEPIQGYIAICLATCGWSCPDGTIEIDGFMAGNVSMAVNSIDVQNYTSFGEPRDKRTCHFLKHANGHKWQPDANGQFEIKAKAHGRLIKPNENKSNYLRFSAFVIW